ncbi:MAG: C25 family cysteine peptidase, partial [Anaerolineales bacterium]
MNPSTSIIIKAFSWKRLVLAAILALSLILGSSAYPTLAARPDKTPVFTPAQPVSLAYNLLVDQDGIYRVTYEDLLAAGLDLAGAKASDIALTLRAEPVPIQVFSERTFGPGAYFEFYGQALDTLYTGTNVYQIQVGKKLARRITSLDATPGNEVPTTYYMESLRHYPDLAYNVASPTSDPWYQAVMYTYTTPKSWDYSIELDQLLPGVAPASLSIDIYGGNNYYQNPDHHVQVQFNAQTVVDVLFDGLTVQSLSASEVPVLPGANTVTITLPGDTGASSDAIFMDGFTITYPRPLVVKDGRLAFSSAASVIQVSGLDTPDAVVYRLENSVPVLLSGAVTLAEDGAYAVVFAGTGSPAQYWVSSVTGLLPAKVVPGRPQADISSSSADYLMISHPDFISGLSPLVQARMEQGYSVRVINVDDIYAQFNYGIYDPQAIKNYIAHAYTNMGTRYILLVGGDSYDYRDYLGLGNMSKIPTFYAPTDTTTLYSPVDPLFADVDGDRVPDLALGRFPVRNLEQLNAIIAKTLTYQNNTYPNTSVFSSDVYFSKYSDEWAALLPEGWSKQFANLDQLPTTEAKGILVNNMNAGTALVNYFGHSSTTTWTSSGLFTVNDVPVLNNLGKPFIVAQYGCWNTYFVNPRQESLGQQFLMAPDRGAAAVLGSATNN